MARRTIAAVLDAIPRLLSRFPKAQRALSATPLRHLLGRIEGRPRRPGPPPGALRPVVYLPTWAHWDEMRQRPQYLLSAFAQAGHQVYFIDQAEERPRRADGVHVVPWISEAPQRDVILYTHFPPLRELFDRFANAAVVYDISDDLGIYEPEEGEVPEERRAALHHSALVEQADVVVVSSDVLAQRHRPERKDLLVVENGVDLARFADRAPPPPELTPDGRTLVGYHGAMSYWFDFELMGAVADRLRDWRFVLVGPVDRRVRSAAKAMQERSNVELLGERPSDEMPAYVQAFDVGTIPFLVTEMTAGVSPLKLYECLAAGVPCVATPLPACVASPSARTGADTESFVAALKAAIEEAGDEFARRARTEAESATWDRRIRPLLDRLDERALRRA